MADKESNTQLLRSLGRLARGLSALFWGLPLTLLVCVQTGRMDWLHYFNIVPPMIATGLLLYGLWLMGNFQKQERPWRNALDRAKFIGLINFGLSPFLYWWNRVPDNIFFTIVVGLLMLSALLFLLNLNFVLQRLGEMLPDETLRNETRAFTKLNRALLLALLTLIASAIYILYRRPDLPLQLGQRNWFLALRLGIAALLLLGLSPLAMTMALIWKTKEVILDSVFGGRN